MPKSVEKVILVLIDFLMIHLAFFLWCRFRLSVGLFSEVSFGRFFLLSMLVYLFWSVFFAFFGHYRTWFTVSRTDEVISVVKTITLGVFVIFMMTFDLENDLSNPLPLSRLVIILYWFLMIAAVGTGRVVFRTVRRKLLEVGIGRRPTLIVGWGNKAKALYRKVLEAPALGYEVAGFIRQGSERVRGSYLKKDVLGSLPDLHKMIRKHSIQEVLIAIPRRSEKYLQQVIAQCDGTPVGIKIVPELYDVIIGQARTNQIYGFPLIEILPQTMQPWEQVAKRLIDVVFSVVMLVGFLPLWLLLAMALSLDSRGPVFYLQRRVGKDGKVFSMIKFRSMVVGAEKMTGPVWATSNDPRVTRVGRFMRKLRLDEIPQLINVLKGDMSLVGPRPERPFFVEKLRKAIPLYSRRLRVQPGITGWAQVKGEYDQSIEHVRKKLEYDLFYLENMSLRMDLKIILSTLYVMLRGKGH